MNRILLLLVASLLTGLAPDVHAEDALSKAALEATFDEVIPPLMASDHVVGAAVVVMEDGKLVTARGYGFADRERGIAVDASKTLFRMGSTSKIVTTAAAMQLQERGRLDLDRDINDYLDFHIPDTYPKKITLRMLMSHRAGFADRLELTSLFDPKIMQPLGEFLQSYLPDRVFPPGSTPAYSNYAVALEGYIVQRVSGMPFEQFVRANIFEPLNLQATFHQPVTDPALSKGYFSNGQTLPSLQWLADYPAGSMIATPLSYARFAAAVANGGELDGVRILQPQSAARMMSFAWPADPHAVVLKKDMGLGFILDESHRVHIAYHYGSLRGFESVVAVYREPKVVFFFVQNTEQGNSPLLARTVKEAFEKGFIPGAREFVDLPQASHAVPTAGDSGWYWSTRASANSVISIAALLGARQLDPLGGSALSWDGNRYHSIGQDLFAKDEDPSQRFAVLRSPDGRVERLLTSQTQDWRRLPLADTPPFNFLVLGVAAISAILLLVCATATLAGRNLERLHITRERGTWITVALGVVTCVAGFWYLIASLTRFETDPSLMTPNFDPTLRLGQALILAGICVLGYALARLLRLRHWRGIGPDTAFVLLLLLSYTWFVVHWNFLTVSLIY